MMNVIVDNPNRFRISSKFILAKISLSIGLALLVYNLFNEIQRNPGDQKTLLPTIFGIIILIAGLYFISTRKRIDYDDIKQSLYVVDDKNHTELEIPVENIVEVFYSVLGFAGGSSSVIVYKDQQHQYKKLRLFPKPFDRSIERITADAKLKNPEMVVRNWSFGWNELFR